MSRDTIRYQSDNHVAVLTIVGAWDSRERINALAYELSELLIRIRYDEEIRVIVLTGSQDSAFSKGEALLREIQKVGVETSQGIQRPAEQIAKIDRPVITAINGAAIGLGLELALACDIRIAADTSRFGLPHIKEGLIPWYGGTQRLPRLVGKAKAMEMILTGEIIDASEAHRIGLVNRILPSEKLKSVVLEIAREMASKSPISLEYAKEAIIKGMDLTLEQGLRLETDLYYLIHTTRDRTAGIKAFQEKREVHFEGK